MSQGKIRILLDGLEEKLPRFGSAEIVRESAPLEEELQSFL